MSLWIRLCNHTYIHTYMHTCIHTYIHTCISNVFLTGLAICATGSMHVSVSELHPNACFFPVFIRLMRIFYFHMIYTCILLARVLYAYETLVHQDYTFFARPMETRSAAHPSQNVQCTALINNCSAHAIDLSHNKGPCLPDNL